MTFIAEDSLSEDDIDKLRECLQATISSGLQELRRSIYDHTAKSCIDKLDEIMEYLCLLEKLEAK